IGCQIGTEHKGDHDGVGCGRPPIPHGPGCDVSELVSRVGWLGGGWIAGVRHSGIVMMVVWSRRVRVGTVVSSVAESCPPAPQLQRDLSGSYKSFRCRALWRIVPTATLERTAANHPG